MDKIQEMHWEVDRKKINAALATKSHATITEDMMGRFAEWVEQNFRGDNGTWYKKSDGHMSLLTIPIYTTSQLINLFKQQL